MVLTTLISAPVLARHAADAFWVVIDCRHDLSNPDAGRHAYDAGHIPHAQFAHLDVDLSDKIAGPNGEFHDQQPKPEPQTKIETLRDWGVNDNSQVVAY